MQSAALVIYLLLVIIALSCLALWIIEVWYIEKKLAQVKPSISVNQSHGFIELLYNQRQNHPYLHSATLSLPLLVGISIALTAAFSSPWLLEFNGALSFIVFYTFLYALAASEIYSRGRKYTQKDK